MEYVFRFNFFNYYDCCWDAAFEMINEIRRQFREIAGLMEGNADPDSEKCVEIATKAALKKMMLPGVIAVAMPAVVGFGLVLWL